MRASGSDGWLEVLPSVVTISVASNWLESDMKEYSVRVYSSRTEWWLNDERHREGGPAVQWANGDETWYAHGQLHREDGPAMAWGGVKFWYLNGQLHRSDGPAIEGSRGRKEYWLNGENLSEDEFNKRTQIKELTVNQLEELLGHKIKVIGE
jgi:hypothetical protein